jgi:hypothetical protein
MTVPVSVTSRGMIEERWFDFHPSAISIKSPPLPKRSQSRHVEESGAMLIGWWSRGLHSAHRKTDLCAAAQPGGAASFFFGAQFDECGSL